MGYSNDSKGYSVIDENRNVVIREHIKRSKNIRKGNMEQNYAEMGENAVKRTFRSLKRQKASNLKYMVMQIVQMRQTKEIPSRAVYLAYKLELTLGVAKQKGQCYSQQQKQNTLHCHLPRKR